MSIVKGRISQILKEKRDWRKTQEELPPVGEKVIIRLCHQTDIYGEDNENIYPVEDVGVGVIDENNKWSMCPPHPRYDYAPLVNKGVIKENVDVTHWALPEKGEIQGWETRFDQLREYKYLKLEVDADNEEDVYRALMFGAHHLANSLGKDFYEKNSEGRKLYEILCDLQHCLDVKEEVPNE